jgi:hypothetical protein
MEGWEYGSKEEWKIRRLERWRMDGWNNPVLDTASRTSEDECKWY